MKARDRIVFECLETPVKHEARVFEMASQSTPKCKQKKKKTKNQKNKSHKHVNFAFCLFIQRTVCDDNVRVFHN